MFQQSHHSGNWRWTIFALIRNIKVYQGHRAEIRTRQAIIALECAAPTPPVLACKNSSRLSSRRHLMHVIDALRIVQREEIRRACDNVPRDVLGSAVGYMIFGLGRPLDTPHRPRHRRPHSPQCQHGNDDARRYRVGVCRVTESAAPGPTRPARLRKSSIRCRSCLTCSASPCSACRSGQRSRSSLEPCFRAIWRYIRRTCCSSVQPNRLNADHGGRNANCYSGHARGALAKKGSEMMRNSEEVRRNKADRRQPVAATVPHGGGARRHVQRRARRRSFQEAPSGAAR
jgi:hypothetical protein